MVTPESGRCGIVSEEHRLSFLLNDTVEAVVDQQAQPSVDVILSHSTCIQQSEVTLDASHKCESLRESSGADASLH